MRLPQRQPDPIPELKRQLAEDLVAHLEGWNQEMAAELIRSDPSTVSHLRSGNLERFSLQQLIRFIARRRATVSIEVRWRGR